MAGANNNSTKLFGVIEFTPRRKSMPGMNCKTIIQTISRGWSSGGHLLLHFADVKEIQEDWTSPMKPTNAEAGPERINAIMYSFRPRCLPSLRRKAWREFSPA